MENLWRMKKDEPGFTLITVLYRDNMEDAKKFMEKNGYTVPVFEDPDEQGARLIGLTGVPETYIVDKEGVLQKKIIGPTTFDTLEDQEFIAGLLAE